MVDQPEHSNDDGESIRVDDEEGIHGDPDEADEDGRYRERYEAARESANPDDHRDEEPHS